MVRHVQYRDKPPLVSHSSEQDEKEDEKEDEEEVEEE